jgi:hypothetical protein
MDSSLILEKEFYEILQDFQTDLKKSQSKLKFSLIGSPLQKSDILMLGNNWGGEGGPSQSQMPLVNDIPAYQDNTTYREYLKFFKLIFDDNAARLVPFFNKMVYTNGNFIRTPNENIQYKADLQLGVALTRKYLKKIIELVEPKIILCFGNSETSGTNSLFKSLGIERDFWKMEKEVMFHQPTSNNWGTYHYPDINISEVSYQIFSFPHASKFNLWKGGIEENEVFKRLKGELNQCLTSGPSHFPEKR